VTEIDGVKTFRKTKVKPDRIPLKTDGFLSNSISSDDISRKFPFFMELAAEGMK